MYITTNRFTTLMCALECEQRRHDMARVLQRHARRRGMLDDGFVVL